jgi:hypothetical protein
VSDRPPVHVSDPLRYKVPWDLVLGLGPKIQRGERTSIDQFTARIVGRLQPAPEFSGLENLPECPRFVLAANHYQRKGLWILHTAAALTRPIRERYGPIDPPVRWMVTANWPRLKLGPLEFPSPGDWLLPKVAHTLWCYPVSFAGANPAYTARALRAILQDARQMQCPLGIFPEGVAGTADKLNPPLPGVDRLFSLLARAGLPVLPARVSESGRLKVQFGRLIDTGELVSSSNAAELVMNRIGDMA